MQSQVSTFKELEEAEYFVAETIHKNQAKIQAWLNATDTRKEHFECSFTRPTDKLLTDKNFEEESVQEVYGVRVVLMPTKKLS